MDRAGCPEGRASCARPGKLVLSWKPEGNAKAERDLASIRSSTSTRYCVRLQTGLQSTSMYKSYRVYRRVPLGDSSILVRSSHIRPENLESKATCFKILLQGKLGPQKLCCERRHEVVFLSYRVPPYAHSAGCVRPLDLIRGLKPRPWQGAAPRPWSLPPGDPSGWGCAPSARLLPTQILPFPWHGIGSLPTPPAGP